MKRLSVPNSQCESACSSGASSWGPAIGLAWDTSCGVTARMKPLYSWSSSAAGATQLAASGPGKTTS